MNITGDTGNTAEATADQDATCVGGAHLAKLWDADPTDALSSVVPPGRAEVIVDWLREAIYHGRDLIDPHTGQPDRDPWLEDIPVIPIDMVAEGFADRGLALPTRQEVREFAEADNSPDPEDELLRAKYVPDPDLDASASAAEKRINGVPESIYTALTADEQAKVKANTVIAPPQSPTAVARWLVRERFSRRLLLPSPPGDRRRRRAWMPILVRIDQVWYSYELTAKGDSPRWVAHTDPEWMRGQLREALAKLWYVKTRQLQAGNEYSLKWWSPDDRGLTQVENALADALNVRSGTAPRELPDIYGHLHGVYSGGTRVLVRNGVLDLETGELARNTPLWFSLTRIEADYDHLADPYADSRWLRMLRTQWGDDPGAMTLLQQWFGYVISGRTDLQKFMWLFGERGSGKTQITDVLDALVGTSVEIGLEGLNDKWGLEDAYETGATLALIADSRFNPRDSSLAMNRLLAITGNDPGLRIPRKNRREITGRLPVRFHGTSNELPNVSDHTGALADRMLILETTKGGIRDTADEVHNLGKLIAETELGGVLRWAVEGLASLIAAGGRFARPANADELADELDLALSNVRQFAAECCELGVVEGHLHRNCGCDYVDEDALYYVWGKWAAANKSGERMSKRAFTRALKTTKLTAANGGVVKPSQLASKPGEKARRVVWGIRRAEATYMDRDRFGKETVHRVASTDPRPADPMSA